MLVNENTMRVFNLASLNSRVEYMKPYSEMSFIHRIVMVKINGVIVYFFISFLAVSWPNGILGAPSCDPLLVSSYYPSSSTSGAASDVRRQQLLNQAKSLLDQLSSPTLDCSADVPGIIPADVTESNYALETLETSLLLNLVNRLNALKSTALVASDPTSGPAISDATLTSLVKQYYELKVLIVNNKTVQLALDDLQNTAVRIFTGKLTKAELPNLCSKTLELYAQLEATNASVEVQDAVNDYIKSLTSALTGQSEVTISAVCNCLNNLETSVVTVVKSDAPRRVQQLLSNLVNAVTNVVISGGGVGCNVIDVVKRYVASIDQAIQQDGSARAKKIYKSVLSFEDELYKALIHSEPKDVAVASPSSHGSASENSASTVTQIGTTSPRVPSDATSMVSNGGTFIIKELLVTEIDDHGNVAQVVQSGTYQIFDPSTNAPSFGSFAVQDGTIESTPDGGIYLKSYGVYDVVSPSSSDKLQGNFAVEFNAVVQVDENENPQLVESGIYTVTDSALGITKSGKFILVNSISTTNPDGSTEIIKTGVLSVDGCDATSTSEQPSVDSDGVYCLFTEQRSQSPNSAGECGRGVFNIKKIRTGETESGTFVVSSSSTTTNSDGSVDQTTSGVYYVDGVGTDFVTAHCDPSLIIMHGSDFTFTVNEAYVKDSSGIVRIVRKGSLVETDPITGIRKSGTSIFLNTMKTKNLDGSMTLVAFSKVNSDFQTIVPGANPSTATTSSLGSTLTTHSAKPLPITKDSLQALMKIINTSKAVEPSPTSGTQSPSTVDSSSEWKVTSIFCDNTAFVVNELVTPVLDSEGQVIDQVRMGTYFLQNTLTNTLWSGSFEVSDFSREDTLSGQIIITASGDLEVTSATDNSLPSTKAQFSIVDVVSPKVDDNGIATTSEGGSYTVTDSGTSVSKTVTYVVENTISKPCPGGATEIIKAGLLFDDSSSDYTKYDGYFLLDDHILKEPDSTGNFGTGMYSLVDPKSNAQITGTYVIEKLSATEGSEGNIVLTTEGVIYVDDCDSDSTPTFVISHGAKFLAVDILDQSSSLASTRTFTQTDSETGVTISTCQVDLLNGATLSNSDGSTNVRKFCGLTFIGNSDNTPEITSACDPNQRTTSSSETVTLEITPGTIETIPIDQIPVSLTPSIDPAAIATDGTVFIIHKHFVPQVDDKGNIVKILKSGEYSLVDPNTNISYTGYFFVDQFSTSSPAPGQIDVEESGTFVLNAPSDGSGKAQLGDKMNYSFQEQVLEYSDDNGDSGVTDTGTFSLINPFAETAKFGTFVVENVVTQKNPDGSTTVSKSGILHINEFDSTSFDEETTSLGDRGSFLFDNHIFATPDSSGCSGNGVYSINDPEDNFYTAGIFSIQDISKMKNPDGTVNLKTSGLIYVNSSSSDPMVAIINGAEFTLDDNLTYVTDVNGNVHAVGSGVFTQIDPDTGDVVTAKYQIQNILKTNNADGSYNIIKSGNFTTKSSTTSTNTSKSGPAISSLSDLKASLEALTVTLKALQAQVNQATSDSVLSNASGSNCRSFSAPAVVFETPAASVARCSCSCRRTAPLTRRPCNRCSY